MVCSDAPFLFLCRETICTLGHGKAARKSAADGNFSACRRLHQPCRDETLDDRIERLGNRLHIGARGICNGGDVGRNFRRAGRAARDSEVQDHVFGRSILRHDRFRTGIARRGRADRHSGRRSVCPRRTCGTLGTCGARGTCGTCRTGFTRRTRFTRGACCTCRTRCACNLWDIFCYVRSILFKTLGIEKLIIDMNFPFSVFLFLSDCNKVDELQARFAR